MSLESIAVALENAWTRLISKDRDYIFFGVAALSSLVALTPFARETSFSNFFIYALLLVVLVFANRERFRSVPVPDIGWLTFAVAIIAGSFALNAFTGWRTGDYTFGLTDYVVLIAGLFGLFYSIGDILVRFGIAVLALLRGATLSLSLLYPWIFASVSAFFVSIVLAISRVLVSPGIQEGSEAGQLIVGGEAGTGTVGIGWACAGLEELVLVTVVLYVLIDSFRLSLRRTAAWLSVGIIGSFGINIARMVILVWIAYNRGIEDMLWVHTHLGDVLFLVWIGVFWLLFFRIDGRKSVGESIDTEPAQDLERSE